METSAAHPCLAAQVLAPSKRGLKRRLFDRKRTVVLMLDEIIITETPPLYSGYSRVGTQREIPITGSRAKRIVHGVINIYTGDLALLITHEWNQHTHQAFVRMIRRHWRGWNIVLFQDRGAPHKAIASQACAADLGIEIRWLPRATPELNVMDHLWRHAKAVTLANCPIRSIDDSAMAFCKYIIGLSPIERLRQAGALSDSFWLAR